MARVKIRDEENLSSEPQCVAAKMADHLVSQVLDEAYVIVNAAKDSGQPWQYVSSLKKLRSSHLNEMYAEDMTFTVSNGDSQYLNDHNMDDLAYAIITSTPQKVSDTTTTKSMNEANFIGQGDEEFEVSKNELRKSTSMFINQLFDMSDVEHVPSYDVTDIASVNNITYDQNEILIKSMTNIMNSYVDTALNILFGEEFKGDETKSNYYETSECYRNDPDVTGSSSYSFLSDAFESAKEVSININEKQCSNVDKHKTNNDVGFYEHAYLTLNRDYEQYSEEDEPVLQDSKAIMPLQEVALFTANTSTENITSCQVKTEMATSGMSTSVAGSRKSTLARRCRTQGARLMTCLRGWWWRRKLFGKRKDLHAPGSIRGLCPLSPDARRRAASLLDQRDLRTPSPSKSGAWKFNTVNEALVHSSRWKEFTNMRLNENDEY